MASTLPKTNWDIIEKIGHVGFYNELRVVPEKHNILLIEAPMNTNATREKMCQIMLKLQRQTYVRFHPSCTYPLWFWRTIGIVLGSGDGISPTVSIHEGYCLRHTVKRNDLARRDLTEQLVKIIQEHGYAFCEILSAPRNI